MTRTRGVNLFLLNSNLYSIYGRRAQRVPCIAAWLPMNHAVLIFTQICWQGRLNRASLMTSYLRLRPRRRSRTRRGRRRHRCYVRRRSRPRPRGWPWRCWSRYGRQVRWRGRSRPWTWVSSWCGSNSGGRARCCRYCWCSARCRSSRRSGCRCRRCIWCRGRSGLRAVASASV